MNGSFLTWTLDGFLDLGSNGIGWREGKMILNLGLNLHDPGFGPTILP